MKIFMYKSHLTNGTSFIHFICLKGNEEIGRLILRDGPKVDKHKVQYVKVKPKHRRQKVAASLYKEATNYLSQKGKRLYPSDKQSKAAKGLWEWFNKTNFLYL